MTSSTKREARKDSLSKQLPLKLKRKMRRLKSNLKEMFETRRRKSIGSKQ